MEVNGKYVRYLWTRSFNYFIVKVFILLLFFPLTSPAQSRKPIPSRTSLPEKIYLQLDRNAYTTGNTIWFKCILLNAYNHSPSSLSRVLYVELIGEDETIHERKLIKIEKGMGQGFFYLNKNLPGGLYLIRAYTQWNRNYNTDFFFREYIRVFSAGNDEEDQPINNITLVKEQTAKSRLEASFNPLSVDSLHKNELTVLVSVDNKKDTLRVARGKDKNYRINYNIDSDNRFATLQMQTSNNQRYSKTIVINKDHLDIQFLPESGELVYGITGRVGFKALDARGQGKQVQGDIIDGKDSLITTFKSNSFGMGSFILVNPDTAKTYYARLQTGVRNGHILLYPLPAVVAVGNVLSVDKQEDSILISAVSNYLENDSIYMNLSFRGVNLYQIRAILNNGILHLKIPANILPEGIIACTMMDNSMRPLAERLYFNYKPHERLNISITSDKPSYAKREFNELKVSATNSSGDPVKAHLSVLVLNKQQFGTMQQERKNILSSLLLESELRGEIENPGFYFRTDSSGYEHIDALMFTQGWRKYHYNRDYGEPTFQPETGLTVSGRVSGLFSKKRRKQAEITVMTFGKNNSVYTQETDSMGNFNFSLKDEYGKNIDLLIQSAKKSGKKMNYTITLDKHESPPVSFDHVRTIEKLDSVVQEFADNNVERVENNEDFQAQPGTIFIDEVEVKGYRLTPERKKVLEEYGEPDEVIEGKEILEKEEKWSYGLYSVLLFNYPDKVKITQAGDGSLRASLYNNEETAVVIDGIPVKWYDYSKIAYIPPEEVSSFEIIEYAKNFRSLYCEAYPPGCANAPAWGNVIAIYTHAGKGLYGAWPESGILKASIPVFSAPREFYAPKYKNIQPDDWYKPDLRSTIHWEPALVTDNLGNAETSFYNADQPGEMIVVVEAISENGEIGYMEMVYEVEGKEVIIVK